MKLRAIYAGHAPYQQQALWVTVYRVVTASFSTVESSARRVSPASTP